MLERAQSAAAASNVEFVPVQGTASDLVTLAGDDGFDAVVCSLVLCSVESVTATVAQAHASLRDGGRFLFWEHCRAPEGTALGVAQDVLTPLQVVLADGCHLNRAPSSLVLTAAPWSSHSATAFSVPSAGLLAPHVRGVAVR